MFEENVFKTKNKKIPSGKIKTFLANSHSNMDDLVKIQSFPANRQISSVDEQLETLGNNSSSKSSANVSAVDHVLPETGTWPIVHPRQGAMPKNLDWTKNFMPETVVRHNAFSALVVCYIMNPSSGQYLKVRALLDSGANLSMVETATAKALGLGGRERPLNMCLAEGGSMISMEKEVFFQLLDITKNKSHNCNCCHNQQTGWTTVRTTHGQSK